LILIDFAWAFEWADGWAPLQAAVFIKEKQESHTISYQLITM